MIGSLLDSLLQAPALLAETPPLDGMTVARVASRSLHILGAIILGGGLFYIRSILSPAGIEASFGERRVAWARWVGFATLLLIVTGLFNLWVIIDQSRAAGEKLPGLYHGLFGVKTLLGLLVMFVAAILAGRTAAADRARANHKFWLNLGWTAVMAIVVIGAILRLLH